MKLALAPMKDSELQEWISSSLDDYIADRIESGEQPELARATAVDSFASLFPDGCVQDGHVVSKAVTEAGSTVGYVWIGPENDGPVAAWWVWDIAVTEGFRSRGYGRQIMELAETEVRDRGGQTLGLHVFGFNVIARELYESLGYQTTSIRMSKSLESVQA